jgi:LEA14-like dessication related protein
MRALFVLGIGALMFGIGCATPKAGAPAEGVSVKVGSMFPKNKSLDGSAIAVKLELYNPGKGTKISRIDYTFDTGEVSGVLKGTSDAGATIEANQNAEVEFEQAIPFPEDREAYRQIIEKGAIPVSLEGTVHFDDGTSVPFERKGDVATPSLPRFVVYDAQAARYGKEGLDVTFFLRLVNENVFTVTIQEVEYAVSINGTELKKESGAIGSRLPQGAGQEFEVSVLLEPKSFPATKQILADRRLTYTVSGKVSVAGLELPFEESKDIELGASEEEEE